MRKTEIFSSLGKEEISILARHSAMVEFKAEATIFEPGMPGDALYVVRSGSVGIMGKGEAGESSLIAELIEGEAFGDLELFTGNKRNAQAKALQDSRLIKFPVAPSPAASGPVGIEVVLSESPEIAARLIKDFLKVVSGRIRSSNALIKENSPWIQELRRQVYGDKLTGLYNKTYLEENLGPLLSDAGRPAALILLKPDNFKFINDSFGHEAGDASLVLMAAELKRVVGEAGTCVKYMGNELGAMLPSTGKDQAYALAERIRAAFNALDVSGATGGNPVQLSVSLGIASYPEHARDAAGLIEAAHALPLEGRARGGNRILFPEDLK